MGTLGLAQAAHAQPASMGADVETSLRTLVSIEAAAPMILGELAIPQRGACAYALAAGGELSARPDGGAAGGCVQLSGTALPAEFTVACAPGAALTLDMVHTDLAPEGASFTAGPLPMAIGAGAAGPAVQFVPCGPDGRVGVRGGGVLTVTAGAEDTARSVVGRVRLEAAYE